MKKGILFLTILLFASITLFPQNTKWVENEVIISLTDTLVDINTNNTKFSLNDIKTKGFIKSDKLQTYLFNNDIESIELHPLFSQLKNFDKEKSYKGHTIKNINDLVTAKIRYTNKKNIEKTIIELEKIEGVVNVSPNFIHSMEVIPNDYRFNYHPGSSPGNNWGFYNWVSPDNDINMETAWNIQQGSPNVKVAVIDNGIDYNNPDLGSYYGANYKVAGGYNFISPSSPPLPDPGEESADHGTKCAGVIGGLNNNKNFGLNFPFGQDGGTAGIAGGWSYNQTNGTGNMGAKLLAYRTPLTSWGNYLATWQARIDGANIINYSRSGPQATLEETQLIWDAYELDGIPYCSSMGNTQDWQTSPDMPGYPAALSDIVIGVGAINQDFDRITFQNTNFVWESAYGYHIDLMAPGIDHYSTSLGNTTGWFAGTSESSPMVAGAAALVKSQNPNLKANDIERILKLTATDIITDPGGGTGVGWDNRTGYGVINVGKALQLITPPNTVNFYTATGGTTVNTYSDNWGFNISFVVYYAIRHEVHKSVTFPSTYVESPKVWGRQGIDGTVGASPSNPNYEIMWCDVVPGTITNTGCELVTYVYKIFDGYSWFWYPCEPNQVVFSYAVAGEKVTAPIISYFTQNPNPICKGIDGTVTANLSQGNPEPTYTWALLDGPPGFEVPQNQHGKTCQVSYHNTELLEPDEVTDALIECTATNGGGTDTENYIVELVNDCPGCPTLAFENEGELINENPLLITSLSNPGTDVTDYYLIQTPIVPVGDEINFTIHEPQTEHTWLDQAQLIEAKINLNEYAAVTEDGEIVNYRKPQIPFTITLNDTLNVTALLADLDSTMLDVYEGDILRVEINHQIMGGGGEDNMILGAIEIPPPKQIMGTVRFVNKSGNEKSANSGNESKFQNFGEFYFRPSMSIICKRLGNLQNGDLEILFNKDAELDYLVIARNLRTARIKSLEILSAVHNTTGDVKSKLLNIDQNYAEIYPGDFIDFTFASTPGNQNKKAYILKTVGRYETDSAYVMKKGNNLTTQQNESIIPKENKLFDNYPNPFNPSTQIRYSIKERGMVRLKVYDALGEVVAELVNKEQPAGTYTVNFNARNLASGIYFYSIEAKDYYKVKKMILLK